MNTTDLLNIFNNFTKEDWQEFDKIKAKPFEITEEEKEAELLLQEEQRQLLINNKLQNIGFERPEEITREFVLDLLETIKAKQFVGEDLETWIDNQILLFGDIETAFNELVIRYL